MRRKPDYTYREKMTRADLKKIVLMRVDGKPLKSIAEEFNTTPRIIGRILRTAVINPQGNFTNWAEYTDSLPDHAAYEFVKAMLEMLAPFLSAERHPLDFMQGRCSPRMLEVLKIIYARKGQTVTRDHIMDVLYGTRAAAEEPEPKIIDVYIAKIRPKLPPEYGTITTVWGYGYRFDPGPALDEKLKEGGFDAESGAL